MNWSYLRHVPWLDTRARFVSNIPPAGHMLDLGSSDGETLCHMAELRPDLNLFAADVAGQPQKYPAGCQFHRADLEKEELPWPDRSMDAITCMHLVEHLNRLELLMRDVARLLKAGGQVYFETPHPKTVTLPSLRGKSGPSFTLNFYDDPTHRQVVPVTIIAEKARSAGLQVLATGISRNWLFAATYPLLALFPSSRKKFTARVHWLGWSAYLIALRPM